MQLLLYKLIEGAERKTELAPETTKEGNKKKGPRPSTSAAAREGKQAKGKDGVEAAEQLGKIDLEQFEDWEANMFTHCVEAVPLKDLKRWLKVIAASKVQENERRRREEEQPPQKESQQQSQRGANPPKETPAVQASVKQGYGAQILSYITFWGGNSSQSLQGSAEQRAAAEAAVEAVTLEEASKESDQAQQRPALAEELKHEEDSTQLVDHLGKAPETIVPEGEATGDHPPPDEVPAQIPLETDLEDPEEEEQEGRG